MTQRLVHDPAPFSKQAYSRIHVRSALSHRLVTSETIECSTATAIGQVAYFELAHGQYDHRSHRRRRMVSLCSCSMPSSGMENPDACKPFGGRGRSLVLLNLCWTHVAKRSAQSASVVEGLQIIKDRCLCDTLARKTHPAHQSPRRRDERPGHSVVQSGSGPSDRGLDAYLPVACPRRSAQRTEFLICGVGGLGSHEDAVVSLGSLWRVRRLRTRPT